MSDSPLMSKMDALLKKHRGGADTPVEAAMQAAIPQDPAPNPVETAATTHETAPQTALDAPPPNAWLPVLTHVLERGTPPPATIVTKPLETIAEPDMPAPSPAVADEPVQPPAESMTITPSGAAVPAAVLETAISDTMAEQLMSELAPRLSEVMEKQVAAELRKNLDQTVASLLSQLDVNVREIVRDAVSEKLKQPRTPPN